MFHYLKICKIFLREGHFWLKQMGCFATPLAKNCYRGSFDYQKREFLIYKQICYQKIEKTYIKCLIEGNVFFQNLFEHLGMRE